jgi:bacteriocin-like protein
MKKVTLADQLALSKEIVANLTEEQLQEIEGGAAAAADSCTNVGGNSCTSNHEIQDEATQEGEGV